MSPLQHVVVRGAMAAPQLQSLALGTVAWFSTPRPLPETDQRHSPANATDSNGDGDGAFNEDAVAVIELGEAACVFVVADGVGGHAAGGKAAALAVQAVVEAVAQAQPDRLRGAVLDAFEAANEAVLTLGVGAATTLVVTTLVGRVIRSYCVGDSMAWVTGQRGRLKHQTVAHSPVGFAVHSGMLEESVAMHHDQRHVVTNVVGTTDMRIDISSRMRLAARDTLLLASDGLFDNLDSDEICARIRKGPLDAAAAGLAETVRERMATPVLGKASKPDDLSFVLFRLA